MLHQAAMLIIFLLQPCPKTANASPSGHASMNLYCCPLHFTAGLRQQGSFAIFYFLMKIKKLSQPPQVAFRLKDLPAALTCTKNINDCP